MKVTLQNLTKKFPSRNKKQPADVIAVNDFTFEIPDGVLLGLLGPSGCGKSTTLNLLSGLQKPTSGRIFFGDDDVTDLPAENRGVGLVFQNYALYPHLTVRQNITFPLENRTGKDKLTHQQMADMALEAAKLLAAEGVEISVINVHTIKPIDAECVTKYAEKCGNVITVEEHSVIGGLGDAVADVLMGKVCCKFRKIGVNDRFGQSGKAADVLREYGLTADQIAAKIKETL